MKKKIFIILLALVFLAGIGLFYLNKVVLPTKIKSLVIKSLQEATQKKVSLDSVEINIFKGLVLKNLKLYDGTRTLLSLKEGSCVFILPLIFKKKIVLSNVNLLSPVVFLERRPDNSLNLADLFLQKQTKKGKLGFGVFIRKISITNGRIDFQDDTFSPAFTKSIDKLNARVFLSLPANVKFDFNTYIPGNQRIEISGNGIFNIATSELQSRLAIKNLSLGDFAGYYKSQGVSISGGTIDALLDIGLKDDTISLHADTKSNSLIFSKGDFQSRLNSTISLDLKYSLKDKQLVYSGNASLLQCGISGLALVGEIEKIDGDVKFNNAGLSSDKISAVISGMPLEAKASLSDFKNPLFNIDTSLLSLSVLQGVLKDKFKIEIPASITGEGKLSLTIESRTPKHLPPLINCRLDVSRGKIALNKLKYSFEGLAGRFEFTADQLKWSGVNFNYQGIPYNTNGTLIDFKAPRIEFVLSSRGLSMESALSLKGKLINIVKAKGRYLNSEFIFSGNLDISNPGRLQADISGKLNIDLKDTKEMFKKLQKQIEQVDPKGALAVSFNLDGDINDFKSCAIQANFSSPSVMAYGLKFQDLLLHYRQENALVELPLIDLSLYDGKIEGSAAMNMSTNRLPYQISLSMGGVNIGKLKMDTPVKNKDIAGTMDVEVKLNGYSNDLSKLSGAGKILISEGKLWELDLFKGMGKLIFAKEFSNIVFHEGSCGFVVQNKSIFTDNLKLKSNLVELDGTTSIGFDGSLDATIKLHVLDNAIPLKETYKDVITAIIGSVDAVGIININGTLKEPVYKFQPAVVDIINGLKDAIFDSILKK